MYVQEKYYKILESTKYDDIETIKRNYKQIIFYNHPDRGGDENFAKEVNMAWEIIKKYHIQQNRQSNNYKTNKSSKRKHSKNTTNKTKNTTNKHQKSSRKDKTNTKKSYDKNNRRCSRCNSKYEKGDVYCTQCGQKIYHKKNTPNNNEDIELLCIGVVIIGVGLLLLSLCWPIGIIYFYLLYKYIAS